MNKKKKKHLKKIDIYSLWDLEINPFGVKVKGMRMDTNNETRIIIPSVYLEPFLDLDDDWYEATHRNKLQYKDVYDAIRKMLMDIDKINTKVKGHQSLKKLRL